MNYAYNYFAYDTFLRRDFWKSF